ncbi:MAG: hypothetical protein J6330_03330 [Clostridia bacterium]|nr:hypothetical protein [Clostridia bacterium]
MKKIISLLLCVLFTAALCVSAAADTSYDRLLLNDKKVNGNNIMASYVTINEGDHLYLLGWAVNKQAKSKLKEAFYTVDGKEYKCTDNYRDRTDVAEALGLDPELGVHAGIGKDDDACELIGIDKLKPGEYDVVIKARYEDGSVEDLVGASFTLNVTGTVTVDESEFSVDDTRLANMKLIAYKDGCSYAFYGLAKFELEKPYKHGDAPDYAVFTKFFDYKLEDVSKNTESIYDEKTGITLFGSGNKNLTDEAVSKYAARFALYEDAVYGSAARDYSEFAGKRPDKYKAAPYEDRLVCVAYSTWMYKGDNRFANSWERPLIGNYTTLDCPWALKAHAELLYDANVDFVLVDWSNNVDYDFYNKKDYRGGRARNDFETIEMGTTQLFEGWSQLENTPKIAVFIGCPGDGDAIKDGRLQKKADQVYREYIENEKYKDLYQTYLGKPLLVVYLGTPALSQSRLEKLWNDDRFTVRFLTGYIGQQSMFNNKTRAATQPIWSWEEREQQCYAVNGDVVECMTVQSAWRAQNREGQDGYIPSSGRENGDTLLKMWARAIEFGPQIVLCPTWNEYSKGEQPTPEINKDLEPSKEAGTFYYDIMKEQIKIFKNLNAEQTVPVDETTDTVTEPVTEAPDTVETAAPDDETTKETETTEKQSNLKPFLYTAAAVVLAAVIAVGTFIFHRKKSEKQMKKHK